MFKHYVGPELGLRCPTSVRAEYRRSITDEARRACRLAVVAEKPARAEVAEGRPLIGTTGQYTRRHLRRAGIADSEVYLTNAVQHFDDPDANPTDSDIAREQPRLIRELMALPRLNCIIALGRAAMCSLSNFAFDGILKRRGSRLPTTLGTKMIPTPHPSFYVNGEWRYRNVVQFDFNRAVRESTSRDIHYTRRDYYIRPTFDDVHDWLSHLSSETRAVAFDNGPLLEFDIESVRGPTGRWYVSQIAFANNPYEGFCIPFMHTDRSPWWTASQEAKIRKLVAELLSHEDWTYGTQNGLYDCWVLRTEGIRTPYMHNGFDTMYAHKLLAPDLPHDLAFINSIYTDEPYYKDESGRNDKRIVVSDEQFQLYNCKDACTQAESAIGIRADLRELDMLAFYYQHIQSQWSVIHDDMQCGGMHIDTDALADVNAKLDEELRKEQDVLASLVGWLPNTRSPLDMEHLFTQYNIPIQRTAKGKARRGEEVLLGYSHKYPHFAPIVSTMLEITRRATLKSNFLSMALDDRGYYHPQWKLFGTTTARLACEGSDEGGPQVLNLPYSIRHVFVADNPDTDELTKADLKQAEKMVVVYDSQDLPLIQAFEAGADIHRVIGCWIYLNWSPSAGLPPASELAKIEKFCDSCLARGDKECTHSRRFVAKQCNHAFDYLMGVRKFVTEVLPPSGVFMSEAEGKRIRDRIVTPALHRWQTQVIDDCKKSLWFTNLFGMKREFYGIPCNDLYREILAWKASSVVSCITAQAMRRVRDVSLPNMRIVHQGYDALLVSHPRRVRDRVREVLSFAFEHKLNAHGREFVIPLEFEHGSNFAMRAAPSQPNTMIAAAGD